MTLVEMQQKELEELRHAKSNELKNRRTHASTHTHTPTQNIQ